MDKSIEQIKATEKETLETFQEEIPSQYFSHLDEKEYENYSKRLENFYRDLMKFPTEMFKGKELIDFGAGTGENTIYLANWGAECTLVEMNNLSQDISKDVFKKYAKNPEQANFILSSIFDYKPKQKKLYDIVHSRGVLAHTAAKEKAFNHIASFLKPGGYLIFGDPNKSGGFQNMLQRYAVYKFSNSNDEMVEVCEKLFKKDIDRSERTVKRTRRAIIFDRWVIQSQDDPSISEVIQWCKKGGMKIYSAYPYITAPVFGNSFLHLKKCDPYNFENLFSIPELTWMMQSNEDEVLLYQYNEIMNEVNNSLQYISKAMSNFSKNSELDTSNFIEAANKLKNDFNIVDFTKPLKNKLNIFLDEVSDFIGCVEKGKIDDLKNNIKKYKVLFTGAVGVRHVDYIAYKPLDQSDFL